ncbi:hypothetical protein MRX96_032219 [Rhipicephalus microplus]
MKTTRKRETQASHCFRDLLNRKRRHAACMIVSQTRAVFDVRACGCARSLRCPTSIRYLTDVPRTVYRDVVRAVRGRSDVLVRANGVCVATPLLRARHFRSFRLP